VKAFRLVEPGRTELTEIDEPAPGPGEVLVRIGSASFCHSDVDLAAMTTPFFPLPVTLGHELAGTVVGVGDGVDGWPDGTDVAVHIIQGCGRCAWCRRGQDNRCTVGSRTPGVHYDGGMAEYVVTPARSLAALDGVDMVAASALTDAGITAYHAVDVARDLLGPRSTALVIGVGGLGHLGLQIVAATTGATVYAVDREERRLELARQLGATAAFDAASARDAVAEATAGAGVDVVVDYVGSADSAALAASAVHAGGAIVFTGLGGGSVGMALGIGAAATGNDAEIPVEVRVIRSFAGGMGDLEACLSLARRGRLRVESQVYALDHAQEAFDDLTAGRVMGRAAVVP
jgi:alcohol dehydrogenase, propanol-preferring